MASFASIFANTLRDRLIPGGRLGRRCVLAAASLALLFAAGIGLWPVAPVCDEVRACAPGLSDSWIPSGDVGVLVESLGEAAGDDALDQAGDAPFILVSSTGDARFASGVTLSAASAPLGARYTLFPDKTGPPRV